MDNQKSEIIFQVGRFCIKVKAKAKAKAGTKTGAKATEAGTEEEEIFILEDNKGKEILRSLSLYDVHRACVLKHTSERFQVSRRLVGHTEKWYVWDTLRAANHFVTDNFQHAMKIATSMNIANSKVRRERMNDEQHDE